MRVGTFHGGATYDNSYLLFVDAAGYSTIVRTNPRDRAAHAFDLLRERAAARVRDLSVARHCDRAALWNWQGDGGFFVLHDERESVARDVALDAARCLLTLDLPQLQQEFHGSGLHGELHLRIAVHKGPIRCSQDGVGATIHSPDVNFAAHLEEATPRDAVAVSGEVHLTAGEHAELFTPVGPYEDKNVALMTSRPGARAALQDWLQTRGLERGTPVFAYPERPSQWQKARCVDAAERDIVDLGTALHTCANYLVTTERPARYRDAVLAFLRRGGRYRCVLMAPHAEATTLLSRQRGEDLPTKIKTSLEKFAKFKDRHGVAADGLHVYQTTRYPALAALTVDLHLAGALILYAPYLSGQSMSGRAIERSEMPQYLVGPNAGRLFEDTRALVDSVVGDSARVL